MISAEFTKSGDGKIRKVKISGHAGFSEKGQDIVCAAASALVYASIGSLEEQCGLRDFYRIDEEDDDAPVPTTYIRRIPEEGEKEIRIDAIFRTLEIGFTQLEQTVMQEFGKRYVRVKEIHDI